jgi:hypothetical protein
MEPEDSLLHIHGGTSSPYPEPDQISLVHAPPSHFLKIYVDVIYIFQSIHGSSKWGTGEARVRNLSYIETYVVL